MRNLQIVVNNEILDVDENTAMGISFRGFSFDDAGSIHLSTTNNFSIPLTKVNRKVFGFPDNMHLNSYTANNSYYDKLDVSVYADGQFLFSGKCYIDSIDSGRINLYLVGGKNFLEEVNKMTLKDVTDIVVDKLNVYLDAAFPNGASWQQIVSFFSSGDNHIWLPYSIGTLNKQYPATKVQDGVTSLYNRFDEDQSYNLEDEVHVCTEFITNNEIMGDYKSGHFCVCLKDVIDWLLEIIGFTADYDSTLQYNLSRDFIRLVDIVTYQDPLTGKFSFMSNDLYKSKVDDKEGKSFSKKIKALDFFKTIVQEYAIVFDVDNSKVVHFKCFNDIKSSQLTRYKIKEVSTRKFSIDGLQQISWIGYASMYGDGSDAMTTGGVKLVCNNKNIEAGNEETIAFSIKRSLVGHFVYLYDDGSIQEETMAVDFTSDRAIEEIIIVRKDTSMTAYQVRVSRWMNGVETYVSANLYKAIQSTVSTSGVYDLYKDNVEWPEEIEVEAFLKTHEAFNFSASNYVEFEGITGTWYVEEISNYNPRLAAQTVKMRAMRVR